MELTRKENNVVKRLRSRRVLDAHNNEAA